MSETKTEKAESEYSYPPSGYSWFLVAMLTIAYVLSFADRYILGLVIEPIKADLNLTDEHIGLIMGPAFGLLYVLAGLPIGWLVDRARRTWIVAAGVTIWSAATVACGLATNFWHLFIARMNVGIGEASLSPSAMSMISDSFPPEKRGKPIGVYTAALSTGAAIASLIGGMIIVWAKTNDSVNVPIFGTLAPWQLTFVAVGLPGLLIGVFFLFLREPKRQPIEVDGLSADGNSIADAVRYLKNNFTVYAGLLALVGVMMITAYSQGFLPSTFVRTWGWTEEKYAFVNAVGLLVFGPSTVIVTGIIADAWAQKGVPDASFRLLIIGILIMVPTSVISMFMPNGELAYAVICLNTVGMAMVTAMGITSLLRITPAQIRGQLVAVYYMSGSLLGQFLGPMTVGILSKRVFGEDKLNLAMAATPIIYGLIPILLIPWIWKRYRRRAESIEA